jgi:DNA-binding MarR family transcriptional regulator
MNASIFPPSSPHTDLTGPPPILIAATSEQARARVVMTAEAAGFRTVAVPVEAAMDRLDIQGAASALWVELDQDPGEALDRLLERVNDDARSGQMAAIVSAPAALIDPIAARIEESSIELLVDASVAERASALALATARHGLVSRLHDISREPSAARLRQLSDEVNRIAVTLARLSVGPGAAPVTTHQQDTHSNAPAVSLDTVRQVIRARRLRARFFDEELFADPAWDMLLDLLQAEIAQHRVPVSSLCIAAAVPATTALRWIKSMTDAGLFQRRADPHDGRRVFVELSPTTSEAMRRYFGEIGAMTVV